MTDSTTEKNQLAQPEIGDPMEALAHFFMLASERDHGGARVAACVLLGLYNGTRFPLDLSDLRLLDDKNHARAMALLSLDKRPAMEVHVWLNRLYGRSDFGMRFEHLAHKWRMKGKCKKDWLDPVEALSFAPLGGVK